MSLLKHASSHPEYRWGQAARAELGWEHGSTASRPRCSHFARGEGSSERASPAGRRGGDGRWTEKPKFRPGAEGLLLRLRFAVTQGGSANFLLRFFPFYLLCLSQKGKRKENAALPKQRITQGLGQPRAHFGRAAAAPGGCRGERMLPRRAGSRGRGF